MLRNLILLGLAFFALAFLVTNSSLASAVRIDFSNAQLSKYAFEVGYFEKFEQKIAHEISLACPGRVLNLVTKHDFTEIDDRSQWTDFLILDKAGNLLFRVEASFEGSHDGLKDVVLNNFQVISCI